MAGYDSHIEKLENDSLGRKPLVATIVDLIEKTPVDWSLRVGIYGRWGSGKTSVLSFIEESLKAKGHNVRRFNPWGCDSKEAMWKSLIDSMLESAPLRGTWFQRLKRRARRSKAPEIPNILIPDEYRATAQGVRMAADLILAQLSKVSRKDVEGLASELAERIIIIIDDIDRLDPSLVPSLLFAVKEVFDCKGLAFVVAFDPEIVGNALKEYHSGFESSRLFLEKILDFHFEISEPTFEQANSLLWKEVDSASNRSLQLPLMSNSNYIFSNPRKIKILLRHLGAYIPIIERYEDDEIDLATLVKALSLRLFVPKLINEMRLEAGIGSDLSRLYDSRRSGRLVDDEGQKIKESLRQKIETEKGLTPSEREKILKLLIDFGQQYGSHSVIKLEEALSAVDSPPIIARKEIRALIAQAIDGSSSDTLFKSLLFKQDVLSDGLIWPYFEATFKLYQASLREFAESETMQQQDLTKSTAACCLNFLGSIIEQTNLAGKTVNLGTSAVSHLLAVHKQWANFQGKQDYDFFRSKERALLFRLVEIKCGLAEDILELLAPWNHSYGPDASFDITPFLQDLAAKVESRMLGELKLWLSIEGYIAGAMNNHYSRKYFLFRPDSPIWTGGDGVLHDAIKLNQISESIQKNFYDWFMLVEYQMDYQFNNQDPIRGVEALAANLGHMKLLYRGATIHPLPYRKMGSIREAMQKLEEKFGYKIDVEGLT